MSKSNIITTNHQRTYTGKYIDVFNPDPDAISIQDIAHALSLTCRWAGHLKDFYSVAQHSVLVCEHVSCFAPENKLQALLHDASEAYINDIPSPAKKRLPDYKSLEDNLMLVIAHKFGFEFPLSQATIEADRYLLSCEWHSLVENDVNDIIPLSPKDAECLFLQSYFELTNKLY
ncbi:MAG: phosphohydrolase [Paludibacter sp.]|nr:phosphohydrolase [Paludibacter sp.]